MKTKLLLSTAIFPVKVGLAFDNDTGWKKNEDGSLATDDNGDPIYVNSQGVESGMSVGTISRLNHEAKSHRERAEAAEATAKTFEGIDPEAARKAMKTVADLDAKKLIDAGEVDKVRGEIKAEYDAELATRDATIAERDLAIDNMKIDNAFAQSPFMREGIAMPAEFVRGHFANNFSVEDGKIVAKDASGNTVMSSEDIGSPAGFEEAIQLLVKGSPHKDAILAAPGSSGSGNSGDGGNRGAGRRITRADFEKLPAAKQGEVAAQAREGKVTITG